VCVRVLVLAVLLAGFGGYAAFRYLTEPARLASRVQSYLGQATGSEVTIGAAHLDPTGRAVLEEVRVQAPGMPEAAAPLFRAKQVIAECRLWSLLLGRARVSSLTVVDPVLTLVEDVDREQFNFEKLRRSPDRAAEESIAPLELPDVFIREGIVAFAMLRDGRYEPRGRLRYSGNLTELLSSPGTYLYVLHEQTRRGGPGWLLRGRFSLDDLSVNAELERFTLRGAERNFLPHRIRQWWNRLEPEGSFPECRLTYSAEDGLKAELRLRSVELNLPFDRGAPRMKVDEGSIVVEKRQVRVERLTGTIEGVRYEVRGTTEGASLEAPFSASIQAGPMMLGPDPPLVAALPEVVQKTFWLLSPRGRFSAVTRLRREEPGGPIRYDGHVRLEDGQIRYARFPYPMKDVQAELSFTQEQVKIVSFTGRGPSGARARVEGTVTPPGEDAHVRIEVTAEALPIDRVLTGALPMDKRGVIDLFFNKSQRERLIAEGRLAPGAFPLGGLCRARTVVERPAGPDQRYRARTVVDVDQGRMLFRYWPYPIRVRSGRLIIEDGRVTVENLQGVGIRGGTFEADGVVRYGPDDRAEPREPRRRSEPARAGAATGPPAGPPTPSIRPDLRISAEGVPIDQHLIGSLPSPENRWLGHAGMSGALDAEARVFADAQGIDFNVDVQVAGATARPYDGSYEIGDVSGRVRVDRESLTIEKLTGRRGDSRLSLTARGEWSQGSRAFDVSIEGRALRLRDSLLDLLDPRLPGRSKLAALDAKHDPAGRVDATLSLRVRPRASEPVDYRFEIEPREVSFGLSETRVALREMAGRIVVRPTHVAIEQVKARFGDESRGKLEVSGQVTRGRTNEADVRFNAEADSIDPTTRALLPEAVRRTIDGLEVDGAYRLDQASFTHHPQGRKGERYRLDAKLRLSEASASIGVPITDATIDLDLSTVQHMDRPYPAIEIELDSPRLDVLERRVNPLKVRFRSDGRDGWLHIDQLTGESYGGVLMGRGRIHLGRTNHYEFRVNLQEADLDRLMHPQAEPDPDATGVISAGLSLGGVVDEPDTRRGRGAMKIRRAKLWEIPPALGALQLLNLSLPMSTAFDHADAEFVLDGDTVFFDRLEFEAPTVALVGRGVMALESQHIDLWLFNRNPAAPKLGALTELFDVVKDELMSVHVTGTLEQPRARAESFKGSKDSWNELIESARAFDGPPDPPAAPNQAAEPIKGREPTERRNSAEPRKSTEPRESAEPSESARPAESAQSSAPAERAESAEPSSPGATAKPTKRPDSTPKPPPAQTPAKPSQ